MLTANLGRKKSEGMPFLIADGSATLPPTSSLLRPKRQDFAGQAGQARNNERWMRDDGRETSHERRITSDPSTALRAGELRWALCAGGTEEHR